VVNESDIFRGQGTQNTTSATVGSLTKLLRAHETAATLVFGVGSIRMFVAPTGIAHPKPGRELLRDDGQTLGNLEAFTLANHFRLFL